MSGYQIAQMNVGRAVAPLDDPRLAEFMNRLDEVNALADEAPGFVWRLQSESGNATDILISDDPRFIVNMSVWENVEDLFGYVYQTGHTEVMAKRRQWFEKHDGPYMVLWWVPAGHQPTPQEGMRRLALLAKHGPTPRAFTFKKRFPQPEMADAAD